MHHRDLSALPPVPWVRERDIDLLMAGLLATEFEFVSWLVTRPATRPMDAPSDIPEHVHAVVNYSRPNASSAAAGETDVLASATYQGSMDELVLSIEDKVWATPQARQGERHRLSVEEFESRWRVAALVGPREWIAAHASEIDHYHLAIPLRTSRHGVDSGD